MDRIAHADDIYVDNGAEALHRHMTAHPGYVGPPFVAPTSTAGATAGVPAYINDGRWVASCPDCNETQIVSKSDHRMLCWACKNVAVDGQWRPVSFPDEAKAIEAELLTWPTVTPGGLRRRWIPGEKVADLRERRMDQLRPSVPRLEDLSPAVADQVTSALSAPRPPNELPEVSWEDDERTKPLVLLGKAKRKAKG